MEQQQLLALLEQIKNGEVSPEDAALKLRMSPFEDIGYACIDHHRGIRQGVPEVIYGQSKTPEQIDGIVRHMLEAGTKCILITRMSEEAARLVGQHTELDYSLPAKFGLVGQRAKPTTESTIVVVTGGTSDMPVAEEAVLTAQALGNHVERLYDVGVAGIHRLLSHMEPLMRAKVIIAVAGMEGALPSVVGGLVSCPVIAVPTSVGYGASFGGVTALLAMLNSCASGISVVNIDNGFGAGYLASMINKIGE